MIYFIYTLGISGWTLVAFLLAYVLAIVVAIVTHEYSHAYVATKFGDPTPKLAGRLTLNPVKHFDMWGVLCFIMIGFGWAKPVPINPLAFRNYKKGTRLTALSGIITNLVLAIFFSAFYYFFGGALIGSSNMFFKFVGYFLMLAMTINISLAIFNLIPIYPLDGFQFLSSFFKADNKFILFMRRWGSLIMLIFVISPLFDIIFYYAMSGIEWCLFSFWGLF